MHLDTHVVLWLHAGEMEQFPAPVVTMLEAEDLVVSPAVVLELQYLHEIGRFRKTGPFVVESLSASIGLRVARASFHAVVSEALSESWTRDAFDRLIVAHAKVDDAPLLTKDRNILEKFSGAFWDDPPPSPSGRPGAST